MDRYASGRREFLKALSAVGVAGLPVTMLHAAPRRRLESSVASYDRHVAEPLGMRPRDPRYNAIPLSDAPHLDATVAFIATRSPISNTVARFQNAVDKKRDSMIESNKTYFNPWDTIVESNPQQILDRREPVTLVPLLIMQGELDDNVLPAIQEKFAASYKAAGGHCELHVFDGADHQWVANEGPQTDRARAMVKAFIARQLKS